MVNRYRNWNEIPATSRESEEMSRDLKKRGFTFAGPTICYAFMQSVGMFNDHVVTCFRHRELRGIRFCARGRVTCLLSGFIDIFVVEKHFDAEL